MDPKTGRGNRRERLAEWAPAVAILLFHLAFLPGYGVFRDELYYIACGRRPGWGYVDQPPLVGWVAWLVAQVAGESHLALRVVAALAMAATVWLAGRTAAALGGGPFARALAGLATGLAPVVLSLGSYYSMNVFDLLFWALIAWILVRVLSGGPERLWLVFGAAAGVGLLNKISVLYLGFAVLVGLVLARRWDVLRSRLFWAGGVLAVAIFLPHLLWQHANGWPTLEFMANARRDKMAPLSAPGFVREALLQTAPMAWLWIVGVAWLLLARAAGRWRALGFAFLVVLAVLAFGGGKPYYLAAAYALAFAAGAVAVETWTAGRARALRPILAVLMAGVGLARLAVRAAGAAGGHVRALRRRARPEAGHRGAARRRPASPVLRGHARLAGDGGGRGERRPHAPGGGPGEGLRLRAELRRGGRRGVLRPRPRPAARDLGPQQLLALGPRRLHGRGARRRRRPAGAAPGALRRRAARRGVPLHGLHALRGRAIDLGRPGLEAADRRPLATDQGLHLSRSGYTPPMVDEESPAPVAPGAADLVEDDSKRRRKEAKLLAESTRPLDPRERYRALVDSLEEAQDLVELADRKARFALVIMGALNIAFFFLATRAEIVDYLPVRLRPFLGFYLLLYAAVALFFFLEAIESLRPRRFRPQLPYPGEGGPEHYPQGLRYHEDIVQRDIEAFRRAWREVRFGQLNAELSVQNHVMARINVDKYRSLRRLYGGLRVLTLLAGGLLAILALSMLFHHPSGLAGSALPLPASGAAGLLEGPASGSLGSPEAVAVVGLREASGIAWHPARGRLFAVGDRGHPRRDRAARARSWRRTTWGATSRT